jgi:gliding motility-associated-like protein
MKSGIKKRSNYEFANLKKEPQRQLFVFFSYLIIIMIPTPMMVNIRGYLISSHMSVKSILPLLCLTFLITACRKDPVHALQGCCNEPGIGATIGNAQVFVANIFTPNGDGFNDYLWADGDEFLARIVSFQIKDKNGQLVYEIEDISSTDPSNGWDGKVNGEVKEGLYTVILQAEATDGTIATLEGKVCNFPCREKVDSELISLINCQYPHQGLNPLFEDWRVEDLDCIE